VGAGKPHAMCTNCGWCVCWTVPTASRGSRVTSPRRSATVWTRHTTPWLAAGAVTQPPPQQQLVCILPKAVPGCPALQDTMRYCGSHPCDKNKMLIPSSTLAVQPISVRPEQEAHWFLLQGRQGHGLRPRQKCGLQL
jgi:hypothetical protein